MYEIQNIIRTIGHLLRLIPNRNIPKKANTIKEVIKHTTQNGQLPNLISFEILATVSAKNYPAQNNGRAMDPHLPAQSPVMPRQRSMKNIWYTTRIIAEIHVK
jgi:hypothetical protein